MTLTVIHPLNLDLVEVKGWRHTDEKGTLGDCISSMGDTDGHVALKERQSGQSTCLTSHSGETNLNRLSYLLYSCVAHSVGVVVVVDDLKVFYDFTFCSREGEVHLRRGFPGSFSVDGEVSGFTHLHTWTKTETLGQTKAPHPTPGP